MSEEKLLELRVSVDVGYRRHSVAMGLSSGEILEEFEIDHNRPTMSELPKLPNFESSEQLSAGSDKPEGSFFAVGALQLQ